MTERVRLELHRLPERRVGPITLTDIVRYAGAGGDLNPIHHDEDFAKKAGYPGVFAMGLLTAGIVSGYVSESVGRRRVKTFTVRYTAQVWPGDTLVINGGWVEDIDDTGRGILRGEFKARRSPADGPQEVVLTATATATATAMVTR